MKIIDLSVTISDEIKEPLPTKIDYEDHKEGAKKMGSKLFGNAPADVFLEGNGPAGEFLYLTSHAGTHVDAPCTISPPAKANPREPLSNCPSTGFLTTAWCWISPTSPTGIASPPPTCRPN